MAETVEGSGRERMHAIPDVFPGVARLSITVGDTAYTFPSADSIYTKMNMAIDRCVEDNKGALAEKCLQTCTELARLMTEARGNLEWARFHHKRGVKMRASYAPKKVQDWIMNAQTMFEFAQRLWDGDNMGDVREALTTKRSTP